jgi:hypothetical protein
MTAKEMFEKIGYVQKIHDKSEYPSFNGIQYMKRSEDSEMHRIGMITTRYIEFYPHSKEIIICKTYEHKDGTITKCDLGILSLEEFKAVQQQVNEFNWL